MVHADLLPEDKVRIIREFQMEAPTAMIGDGLNDAPALATADIGISMGISGSALATETGHIILMSNNIRKIPMAVRLAKKTRQKVIENMILSVIPKASVLALAIAGYSLVWVAVLADVGTCLLVIFNSMLLLRETETQNLHYQHGSCSATVAPNEFMSQSCSKERNNSLDSTQGLCEEKRCEEGNNVTKQRQTDSCCRSSTKECCRKRRDLGATSAGGLSEIIVVSNLRG